MPVSFYDEIELEDMSYDEEKDLFHYPCPCGDRFEITRQQLKDAEDVARCPSCSLIIRVVFDPIDFEDDDDEALENTVEAANQAASVGPEHLKSHHGIRNVVRPAVLQAFLYLLVAETVTGLGFDEPRGTRSADIQSTTLSSINVTDPTADALTSAL
ncbi:hypothetical protein [Sporisorium scitamineum]|uniref:Diphthamide biosynthesis protein 3 n=1 Tax=Sporisorium scitamineum TaxID=49012 RepID=A0A0F7S150_9BASI|nr:hypothetical protein [Sporisorium scitamineum]